MKTFLTTAAAIALLSGAAQAEDAPAADVKDNGWKGSVEGGLDIYSGNTNSTNIYGKAALDKEIGKWTHGVYAEAFNQEQSDVRTGEKYRAGLKTRYDFTERFFGFGEVEYNKDRFSGFDYRIHEDVGVGYIFVDNDKWHWDGLAGIGLQHTKEENGDTDNSILGKVATNIDYHFNENVSFHQKAEALFSEDLNTYRSDTSVKSKISDSMSFKAGYRVEKLSSVPAGRQNSDSHTYLGVAYDF